MFAYVARCTDVSTTQSYLESGSTDISNIRSAPFDFQQTGYRLQTNKTISTQDRGIFMLVATILRLKEWQGSYAHFLLNRHNLTLK